MITDCILETIRLSKDYITGFMRKKVKALTSVSMQIRRGEVYGCLGHNGAGKTTTIKILTGLIHATSGKAFIFGKSCTDSVVRQKIGFLPEHPYFYDYLSVFELLKFYGTLFNIRKNEKTKRIHYLLGRLGLEHVAKSKINTLSKGLIQRVGIAQSLINDPDLLIWDEPMSGLDPIGRKEVKDLILELKEEGRTLFISSHVLPDMEIVCDRVAILVKGHLVYESYIENIIDEMASTRYIEVIVSCNDALAIEQMEKLKYDTLRRENELYFRVPSYKELDMFLPHIMNNSKVRLLAIIPHRETLEDIFAKEMALSGE
jgi:ABC-2 type transport system ATP-binding protein